MINHIEIEKDPNWKFRRQAGRKKFRDCIGKLSVSKGTNPEFVARLMQARPHTLIVDGEYI